MEIQGSTSAFESWLDRNSEPGTRWYIKQLSANDTLASESHQAGPYLPKIVFASFFPSLMEPARFNPDTHVDFFLDSHDQRKRIRAVWYNNKVTSGGKKKGTRDECRFTQFGGHESALLDPEVTGDVIVLSCRESEGKDVSEIRGWLCNPAERLLFESLHGDIEPNDTLFLLHNSFGIVNIASLVASEFSRCRLQPSEIPKAWLKSFPSAIEILEKTLERLGRAKGSPDQLLLARRNCEYEIFRSVEEVSTMPRIAAGFKSVDEFVGFASSVANRRKARGGLSLELHLRKIFCENGLQHSHGEISEGKKRPDFLFPSAERYRDSSFPKNKLRMLAAKTTCKDRWRQVLNEADRIAKKHLFTLQKGVSENQYLEMEKAGVALVVPKGYFNAYPKRIRPKLMTLQQFITDCQRATA